ncbi:MAG: coproporphyrinogen dehydrogenase HemZ [Clostridium sp.]|nr:coproporphyrinogen dehydrogenase HemZ [Clostridium sp.]MCM1399115.1 coproporphyrinogen dehydrogenase HemZ [Clostridium sp.]MCM1459507.1 coproporphyrinogen dehydrogenase HemZ [Bacteroides sp.]
MIQLVQNKQDYNNDLRAMLMAFFPRKKIMEKLPAGQTAELVMEVRYECGVTVLSLRGAGGFEAQKTLDMDYRLRDSFRNGLKMAAYELLCGFTKRTLPWGDLTGVRPTKIAMKQLKNGADIDSTVRHYIREYGVSEKKARLGTLIAGHELTLTSDFDFERDYCLYIGIPFCPSRCLYCSFTSYPIEVYRKQAKLYIERLKEEISTVKDMLHDGRRLVSIYIGGGTPTSISHELLDELLTHIDAVFDRTFLKEYTVEAGRPDSLTEAKLKVLKAHGITRISINPQTMNDATLEKIGRAHTSAQTEAAFRLARACGFDNINMDIIAGLPGEDIDSMEHTLARLKRLSPESITVHSLAIKRAANLNHQMDEFAGEIHRDTDRMLDAVGDVAASLNMEPYYLYRQKNIGGNLENVGYALPGRECLYNILIMEELTDIIALGAGASTKLTFHKENRVERTENCKSVDDYIERLDEMLDRKRKLLL